MLSSAPVHTSHRLSEATREKHTSVTVFAVEIFCSIAQQRIEVKQIFDRFHPFFEKRSPIFPIPIRHAVFHLANRAFLFTLPVSLLEISMVC